MQARLLPTPTSGAQFRAATGIPLKSKMARAAQRVNISQRSMTPRSARRRFGLKPDYLVADTAYGSADNLAWLVKQKRITPHIPVFDKSARTDGTFSRSDFTFDPEADLRERPGRPR
jgi:hypothetical protein